MERDRMGGVPYEVRTEGEKLVFRFYPKSHNAKNPDGIVFALALDGKDQKKLLGILK